MSARSAVSRNHLYRQVVEHLKTPLFQNGYALTLSSVATSVIGLVYWVIAAHRYSVNIVGINSAVISAMMFLAGVAELNLMSAIIRFIPTARRSTWHFVIYSYLVSILVAAGISFIFIEKLEVWSPTLQFLGLNPTVAFWFILSTMIWCIFVLQDSVLTGLRQTMWVPVENTVFSLAKIGLMIVFANSFPSLGLFASWSFALLISVIPTNYYIFRKLIPLHEKVNERVNVEVQPRQVIRFAAIDYVGALFWLISTTLMPVVVATLTGGESNAYFYLSWTIANSLYLFSSSMGQSLVVEAAKDRDKLASYSYRAFINIARIVVVAAVVLVVGAPILLNIYGKGYSTQGTNLLRLLSLSAVPFTINAIFVSVARVQYRMTAVVAALGSLCISVMGLSYVLLRQYGIIGVGYAWLISQTLVAAVIYFTQLRKMWLKSNGIQPRRDMFEGARTKPIDWMRSLAIRPELAAKARSIRNAWISRQNRELVERILPEAEKTIPGDYRDQFGDHWGVQRVLHSFTDTTVAFIGSPNKEPSVVLKLQRTTKSQESQKKNCEALLELLNTEDLGEWRNLLPAVIAEGNIDGLHFSVERVVPGIPMIEKLRQVGPRWQYVELAAVEINNLHRLTAQPASIDQRLLDQWIDQPLNRIRQLMNNGMLDHQPQQSIERLREDLYNALAGKQLCTSWIHGDYSPANILVSPNSSWITGIVDWDLAHPAELPMLDIIHLLFSFRMEIKQCELGPVLKELLIYENWTHKEQVLMQNIQANLPADQPDTRTLLILSWLRHINANLAKSTRFENHRYWIAQNVGNVIRAL